MTRKIPFDDHSKQQVEFTTCYMCACRCGIKVTLEEGKVRFIQGNRNHPVNQGRALREGRGGNHEAVLAGAAAQAAPATGRDRARQGEFDEIEWDEALDILTRRLKKIRATDPTKLAFFTGRDQMQALSGLWAQQFGTPNWAAHGGFCSVNMAVAGLYTHRLFVLGIRRARLGPRQVLHALGRGRGSLVEPDQDRTRQAQAPRREVRIDQSGPHRLFCDRRRVAADSSRHRRACSRSRSRTCCSSAASSTGNS